MSKNLQFLSFVKKKVVSLQLREKNSGLLHFFRFMELRHLLKSYFKGNDTLAVMRSCIIEITGSRRPHKADSVNPRFYFKKSVSLQFT